ncbi:MAG: extracellular solute-binding protein [Eubacterium sp.]|nr:extracellular solute-binding protein [Eubacterium sp.]
MSKIRRWLSFTGILGMVLMLCSGCGGADGGKKKGNSDDLTESGLVRAGNGRFIEEEVTLPKEIRRIKAMEKLADGSLEVIGESKETGTCFLLRSPDGGKKWDQKKIDGLGKDYRPQTAIAPDGRAVLLSYMKEGTVNAKIADTDGTTKDVTFSLPDDAAKDSENQIVQSLYDAEGNLVVLDMHGVLYEVTAGGVCKKAYDTKGADIRHFSIAGTTLYAVHEDGILIFDTKEKKALDSESVLDLLVKKDGKLSENDTDRGRPLFISSGTKKDAVMLVWEDGIFHFTRGGSVMEQLADSAMTSLSGGDLTLLGLAAMDDKNILIAAYDGESDKLFHYTYDKEAAAAPEKELSVYALDDSAFLRQAVKLFQKNNPDVHVKLEFGLSGKDGVTLEDALSTLNTNILAGKGPDVLILDGMPVDSYISKGILCDITDIVDEIDKKDGIFQGIKEGSKKDGKIYAMPVRFLISIVEGDKDTVAAGQSLPALAKRAGELRQKKPQGKNIIGKGNRTLLRDLYYADSASWQKEDGTLDQNALKEYLTYAKQMSDLDSVGKEDDFQDKEVGDGTFGGEKVGSSNSSGLLSEDCQISIGSLAGIYDLQTMCSIEVQTKTDYCLMNSGKVRSYIPYLTAGIIEGRSSETAKAFVRELLGKKAGNSASNGIPVNRAAYDAVCEEKLHAQNVKDDSGVSTSSKDGKTVSFEYVDLTKEDEDKLTNIIESLTTPSMTNRVIQEMVLEQGEKYLQGELSLESAAEAVLKKVNLYLAENGAQ